MAKTIQNLRNTDGGYTCTTAGGCLIEGIMTAGTINFGANGSITPGDAVLSLAVTLGPVTIAIPEGYAIISDGTADLFVGVDTTPYNNVNNQ